MIVRCGSCRTEFEVPGPGRFSCPVCGSVNMVRQAPAGPPPSGPGGMPGGQPAAPKPPPGPDPPSPRLNCPECDFSFIVGQIEVASCPNCGGDVPTGWVPPDEDE